MANAAEVVPSDIDRPPEVVELDIDGVPLRDHKRIDLKSILGHEPEVDEDDDNDDDASQPEVKIEQQTAPQLEESSSDDLLLDAEDDEAEPEGGYLNSVVQRQRRSSLRAQHHEPPDSPSADRKAVRFADSLGIGLEAIRDLAETEEDQPPLIPHSAMTALRLRRKRTNAANSYPILVAKYEPRPVDDAFLDRLDRHRVLLESSFVSSRELTVSGVVRVAAGSSLDKTVTVRYTTDSWASHRDVPANYVPNSNDGHTDRFVFIIHLQEGFGEDGGSSSAERLEFAVALHAASDTFWDNNEGGNYVIDCVMRSREPSVSGDTKIPDDDEIEEGQTIGGVGE